MIYKGCILPDIEPDSTTEAEINQLLDLMLEIQVDIEQWAEVNNAIPATPKRIDDWASLPWRIHQTNRNYETRLRTGIDS